MTSPLRVLFVEDSPSDAKLLERELRRVFGPLHAARVEDAASMRAALSREPWDVVLSDWSMPTFTAPEALALLQELRLDLPLLIVSGAIGEENAVEALRAGARDYIHKDRLARLGAAVQREVEEKEAREARRRAEEARRQSEERLKITLHSIGDAVISTDGSGRVDLMNAVACAMTGWSEAEARGRPLSEVFPIESEDTGLPMEDPVARVLREGCIVGLANHTLLRARDGTRRPIADSAAPIRDAAGEIQGVVLVFRDQTAERAAAAALRATEGRRAAVLESAMDSIITVDHEGHIVDFNAAAERTFGCPASFAVGKPLAELIIPPRLRPAHRDALERYRTQGAAGSRVVGQRIELSALRADGTEFPAEVSIVQVREVEPLLFVGFIRDLTEQKRAAALAARSRELELQNARIQEASRLKSEFLANMSHELRTPLNSIIGFAELLHDGEVGPTLPRQKEFLGDILSSGRHLLQLINDVLDLAKVEAGKLEFHPEPIQLERLIGEVTSILRTAAASKQIALSIAIEPSVCEVTLDAARLKQVLYNYLSNALKFTPEGGHVTVRVQPEGERSFRLEVQDDGIGIAPGDLERLFVEFQQLDAGAAKKYGGTGLGLALTRKLVEAQGGKVGVRSTLGEGSTFYAVLPLDAGHGQPWRAS